MGFRLSRHVFVAYRVFASFFLRLGLSARSDCMGFRLSSVRGLMGK